jgi:ubiquinone/menaquinone biosynthesis C-methylase UbiE
MEGNYLKLLVFLGGAMVSYFLLELAHRFLKMDGEPEDKGHWEVDEEWDTVYRDYKPREIPWEAGEPDEGLVRVIEDWGTDRGRALDLGSGLGTQGLYLARMGFRVSGIDLSPTAVKVANRRADLEGSDCSFIQGDVLNLPYPDESFSLVLDRGCFHHISADKREQYVRGVHRVVKRGGRYYLICFSYRNGPGWNHFTRRQIGDYFDPYFNILDLDEGTFKERSTGHVLHFLRVLMEKAG